MSKEKEIDMFDDICNEIADNVLEGEDMSSTSIDVEEWFENSEYSPKKFNHNQIWLATGSDYSAQLYYQPFPDDGTGHTDTMGSIDLCSASLKSSVYLFDEISPKMSADDDKNWIEYKNICIYGHPSDIDDEFNSRLDMKLVSKFSPKLKNKFTNIKLCGCFESIEKMEEVIIGLYEKLSDLSPMSRIQLYLESNVKDDEGKVRNIADLLASGYIKPSVVNRINMVEYVYKKFDKRRIARLYTKELPKYSKDLFDNIIEPNE